MWDALSELSVFVATARAGGIRPAAAQLGVPRSTVSRRLALLERRLGVRLLLRSTKGLVLTDVAREAFDRISRIVDSADALVRELSGQGVKARGTLRVAASTAFADALLAPILAGYTKAYPEVTIELYLAIEKIDLRKNRIDVAFRTTPLDDDDEFTGLRLGESVNGFFAAPSYLAGRRAPLHPRELREHVLVAMAEPGRKLVWRYAQGKREGVIAIQPKVVASSFASVLAACVSGVGVARLPSFLAAPAVDRGELVPLMVRHWHESAVYAVFPKGVAAGMKTRAFVEHCRAPLATALRGRPLREKRRRPAGAT